MKAMRLESHGGPDVLRYTDVPDPEPGPGDVVVAVEACALNNLDVVQRNGWFCVKGFQFPHIAGMDVAGTVAAVGSDVDSVSVGTRVVVDPSMVGVSAGSRYEGKDDLFGELGIIGANLDGGYAEYCLAPASHVFEIPDHITAEHAATFPTIFMTAGHAIFEVGHLTAGETILINAAGSGVSVAAIQMAVRTGATVLATAGSEFKLDNATRLGAAHVANNRSTDIEAWVREVTDGRGVDIVLEHVGPALFAPSFMSLAVGGRLVCCGNTTGNEADLPSLEFLFHNEVKILGSGPYRPEEFAPRWKMFCDGDFENVVDRVYGLESAGEAQAALEQSAVFGKVVLKP